MKELQKSNWKSIWIQIRNRQSTESKAMEISRRRTGGTAINLHSFLPPSLDSDAIADTIKSFFSQQLRRRRSLSLVRGGVLGWKSGHPEFKRYFRLSRTLAHDLGFLGSISPELHQLKMLLECQLPLSERADLSAGSSGGSVSDAKPSASSSGASTAKVSTDKYQNSAVVAGVITTTASLGWSPKASRKKEEVQD
ncbi:hypothetical protein ACFX13_041738 [Malus domestica]